MVITKEQSKALEEFCEDHDYDYRPDYSGRGMMGRTCIGFVTDDTEFKLAMSLVCHFGRDAEMVDVFVQSSSASDDMGKSTIIYFPNVSVDE